MNHSTSESLDSSEIEIDSTIARVVMNHNSPEFLDLSKTEIDSTMAPNRIPNFCGPMAPSMPNMIHGNTPEFLGSGKTRVNVFEALKSSPSVCGPGGGSPVHKASISPFPSVYNFISLCNSLNLPSHRL